MENTKPLYYDDLMKEWQKGGCFYGEESSDPKAIAAKVALLFDPLLATQEEAIFVSGFLECAKLMDYSLTAALKTAITND